MANKNGICLVGAMDHLWFHKIILSSQPISLLCQETLQKPIYQLSNNSIPQDDEILSETSTVTLSQDETNNEKQIKQKKRPTRQKIQASKSFSHSSSSSSRSTKNRSKNLKYSGSITGLNKTMSCKSLEELEVEEVKGFIDLGFKFNIENLNPTVMKVLPGLQRLKKGEETEEKDEEKTEENDEEETEEFEEELAVIKRPYLSEAWIVKRSEFPLIKLRVPIGESEDYDLKKQIKDWAKTVACSVIYQES